MKNILFIGVLIFGLSAFQEADASQSQCEIPVCVQSLGFTPQAFENALNETISDADALYDRVKNGDWVLKVKSFQDSAVLVRMKASLAVQALCSDSDALEYLALVLNEESFVAMFKQQDEVRKIAPSDMLSDSPKEIYKKMLKLNRNDSVTQRARKTMMQWYQLWTQNEYKKSQNKNK